MAPTKTGACRWAVNENAESAIKPAVTLFLGMKLLGIRCLYGTNGKA